ncbi:MAG: type VII toxin-antitoxin system HepT family RNase toxin [Acidimicrobiales bacterium]
MVEAETVRRRLREIDRRVSILEALRAEGREPFLADIGRQAQAERHLQLAIQSAIDVALHVVAEDSAATPETYGSTFSLLADQGWLTSELANQLRRATGLRNVLVHGYLEVDPSLVWEHLEHLSDLRDFARSVDVRLRRQE